MKRHNNSKRCTYFVDGMHCASCQVLIEKKIKGMAGVEKVNASLAKGRVEVEFKDKVAKPEDISTLFKENGYVFSTKKFNRNSAPLFKKEGKSLIINKEKFGLLVKGLFLSAVVITLFLLLENSKIGGLVSITDASSYPSFFLFGLIAGISSCAALVGGLLLSLSDQWSTLYIDSKSKIQRAYPFLMFILGRTIFFGIFGGALGILGKVFGFSISSKPVVTSIIIGVISVYMLILGLGMLGVRIFDRFQIKTPKFLSRIITDETRFKGRYMPFIVGALTFFLPCGFTINAQAIALSSGSFLSGFLIMLFFVLGTLPLLGVISFSSVSIAQKPKLKAVFEIVAGVLVILFALYNLNAQLNVLGLPSISDLKSKISSSKYTSEVLGETQVLETVASASGYTPANAVVKAGVPVVWKITDDGTTGCTNAIISKQLFGTKSVALTTGLNTIELPALEKGYYKYSCWMGMYSGVIRAI